MKRGLIDWFLVTWLMVIFVSCSEKNDPAPQTEENNLVEATLIGSRTAAELQILIQLSGRDIDPTHFQYDVEIYKVIYKTAYKGLEINASGLILLPKTNAPAPMLSFQHGTIIQQSDAPSVQSLGSLDVISYSAMASMGFVTVVPDMIGFGVSKDIFHPYYVAEPTSDAVIHNLLAAKFLAEEKAVTFDNRVFLAGYSQGGYATMAAHKAMEENAVEDFELIASFPAAGGYDIKAMQEYFFGLDTYPQPYYLAYVGRSYQTYYDETDLLSDFFNEPYASKIPSLFDGVKNSGEINAELTNDITMLVSENMLANVETDAQYEYLRNAFEDNSLVDWAPALPIYLYHGDADTTVPFENSQITYEKMLSNGATPDNIKLITLHGANHSSGIEPYIEDVIKKLQELK